MSKYRKEITVDSSSCVSADIYDGEENRGHEWWIYGLFTQNSNKALEKRLVKANKWADERIKTLERGVGL